MEGLYSEGVEGSARMCVCNLNVCWWSSRFREGWGLVRMFVGGGSRIREGRGAA